MICTKCLKEEYCERIWRGCCAPNIGSPLWGSVENDLLYCVSLQDGTYCLNCIYCFVKEGLMTTTAYQCKFCKKFENIAYRSSFSSKRIIRFRQTTRITFWNIMDEDWNNHYMDNTENPERFKSCNTDWAHVECITKKMDPDNVFSNFLLKNMTSLHSNVTDIITNFYFPTVSDLTSLRKEFTVPLISLKEPMVPLTSLKTCCVMQ